MWADPSAGGAELERPTSLNVFCTMPTISGRQVVLAMHIPGGPGVRLLLRALRLSSLPDERSVVPGNERGLMRAIGGGSIVSPMQHGQQTRWEALGLTKEMACSAT